MKNEKETWRGKKGVGDIEAARGRSKHRKLFGADLRLLGVGREEERRE